MNSYARRIPSYARQTGLACSACHTVFPQLTALGREFKLNGYTLTNTKTITDNIKLSKKGQEDVKQFLRVLGISPMSGMFQTGYTSINSKIPDTQNNNLEFPQQLSLFYAGQISPNLGTFIQITLDNESGTVGLDNTDIRYANQTNGNIPITYGLTLNNNPTVQDLWNTTPAWGFPYTSSGIAPTPSSGLAIEDLGGMVAGLGAYVMIDNLLYLELSGYRTAQLGAALPPDSSFEGAVNGTAPYWRAALQKQFGKNYVSVGTFGMATKLYPVGVTGNTDNFTDTGFDLQFERIIPVGQLTLHTDYINEKQTLNATYAAGDSENLGNKLKKFNIDGSLFLKQQGLNFTAGYFNINGSSDTGLYAPEEVFGSINGSPNSSGIRTQIDFLPWENTQLSLQYFAYNKFNGSSSNYDGFGRDASNNNMIYLQLWFAF
ncbi:cytochrome c [Gaetbulibacter aestuarii]